MLNSDLHLEYKIKKASDFESQGKLLHAVQVYQNVISECKELPLVYVKLASLYEKLDKHESAIRLLKGYIDEIHDDSEVRIFLAQLFLKYGYWNDGIEMLSVFTPEENAISSFFLGYAYFMIKEYEIAKVNFNNFLVFTNSNEFHSEALLYLAKIDLEYNNYDRALGFANQALSLVKDNWEVHLVLGIINYHKSNYKNAAAEFERAIKLNDSEAVAFEWAGKAYLKLGDYLKAETYFLDYVANSEVTSEAYSYLGLACLNAQKIKEAITYFNLALNLDPANEVALEGIDKCSSIN